MTRSSARAPSARPPLVAAAVTAVCLALAAAHRVPAARDTKAADPPVVNELEGYALRAHARDLLLDDAASGRRSLVECAALWTALHRNVLPGDDPGGEARCRRLAEAAAVRAGERGGPAAKASADDLLDLGLCEATAGTFALPEPSGDAVAELMGRAASGRELARAREGVITLAAR